MELLNKIMESLTIGIGLAIGWALGTLFLGHCTVGRSVGNGCALLVGWVLATIAMHFLGKLKERFWGK